MTLIMDIATYLCPLWDIILVRFNISGVGRLVPGHSDPICLPVSVEAMMRPNWRWSLADPGYLNGGAGRKKAALPY